MDENTMIEKYGKLVYYVAKAFKVPSYERDDIISSCWLGFAKALKKYNKNSNFKFTTFAITCMKNECLMYFRQKRKQIQPLLSLDENINETSDTTYYDIIANEEQYDVDTYQMLTQAIHNVTHKYSDMKKKVVKSYLENDSRMRDAGKSVNISQSYASRIVIKFRNDVKAEIDRMKNYEKEVMYEKTILG